MEEKWPSVWEHSGINEQGDDADGDASADYEGDVIREETTIDALRGSSEEHPDDRQE